MHDTKNIMVENIEKLFDRDQKINLIAIKSNNLNQHSKNINYVAAKIKKQEKMKQMKIVWMVGGAAAVKIFSFYFIFLMLFISNLGFPFHFVHNDLLNHQ